jgi:hypothetical protein
MFCEFPTALLAQLKAKDKKRQLKFLQEEIKHGEVLEELANMLRYGQYPSKPQLEMSLV